MIRVLTLSRVSALEAFETSQFKRSVAPNGPKLTSGGALSPRGDWRMPSDSSSAPWLEDIQRLKAWAGVKS